MFVQPLSELIGAKGWTTTVADLTQRAVTQSDSAAVDILVERLGGPERVQAVLTARALSGISFDRDEKHLQSDVLGITWSPALVEADLFARVRAAVPRAKQLAAYEAYRQDTRDTATPAGMVELLLRLARCELLSRASTTWLRETMQAKTTGTKRLKAGLAPNWTLGHKTGTSSSFEGLAAATNDVGLLTAPNGETFAVAVFLGDSRADEDARDAAIAAVARAIVESYRL
ncbi:MAG: serine hydrolase [Clostridia bacterium]|nr:serine hydrolase [Deltaproteobacteria bacterium]